MAQLLDLCNRALSRLGARRINALTLEDSPQAAMALELAQPRIDALLAEFPWRFAIKTKQLTRLAGEPPEASGWSYHFAVPTDCLRLHKIHEHAARYEIHAHPNSGARVIYSNTSELWADMVLRIEAALFPAHVEQAATAVLAAEFAMPITRTPAIATYWEGRAVVLVSKAIAHDANEQPWEDIPDGDMFVNARFGP